jgi:hypothetical protein
MEVNDQRHALRCFTPGEIATGTHLIGGWVDTRAGLEVVQKRKVLLLNGLEPPAVQSVALHYVD